MDLRESAILGDTIGDHWYYRSKAAALMRIIGPLAPGKILDVGAGSGFFSRYLLEHTGAMGAVCVDPGYEFEWDHTVAGKAIHFRHSVDAVDAGLVLMMDVLEHVDDDVGLLRWYASRVLRGTPVVVTVPAFRFLWSAHDEYLEHKRRYTLSGLEAVVRKAGLSIQCGAFYFGAVLPIAVALRMSARLLPRNRRPAGSQLMRHDSITNALLAGVCRLELPLLRWNRLGGLTIFCLART